MRLINVQTYALEEFYDSDLPYYAILSHTWGKKEISYQEILQPHAQNTPEFAKIANACRQARHDGWPYIWIDTCCIDKTSSAELSEAINSMYRWYEDADVCYAYLEDVDWSSDDDDEEEERLKGFRSSRWFTRGWTLQELLAPPYLFFYDRDWKEIGSKQSEADVISEVTAINVAILRASKKQRRDKGIDVCAAVKLSWASKRETTRVEDMAYCLLGLFDINMPLLYGEGAKAFGRLQYEIIKRTRDESIFAWRDPGLTYSGLFARSPYAFRDSGGVFGDWSGSQWDVDLQFSSASAPLRKLSDDELAKLLDGEHGWQFHDIANTREWMDDSAVYVLSLMQAMKRVSGPQRWDAIDIYLQKSKFAPASFLRIIPGAFAETSVVDEDVLVRRKRLANRQQRVDVCLANFYYPPGLTSRKMWKALQCSIDISKSPCAINWTWFKPYYLEKFSRGQIFPVQVSLTDRIEAQFRLLCNNECFWLLVWSRKAGVVMMAFESDAGGKPHQDTVDELVKQESKEVIDTESDFVTLRLPSGYVVVGQMRPKLQDGEKHHSIKIKVNPHPGESE